MKEYKVTVRVSEEERKMIQQIQEENGFGSNDSAAFRFALRQYFVRQKDDDEKIKKLNLRVGNMDKSISVIMEILNSMIANSDMKKFYSREQLPTTILIESEKYIEQKIAKRKEDADWNKEKWEGKRDDIADKE